MSILVLTGDPLPLPALPATGAGLRAWGLARGLRSAGLDARAVMPRSLLEGRADPNSEPYSEFVYPNDRLTEFTRDQRPDAVVAQHWGIVSQLGEIDAPLAIDLAGPHLLERRHWGHENLRADWSEMLKALRRADFVVCSGWRQRAWFLPWLIQAGFDPIDPGLCPVIPFGWSPEGPPERPHAPGRGEEIVFLSGGTLLPWQNPAPAIETALSAMEEADSGRLIFCGGAHPSMNVAGGEHLDFLRMLERHPRTEVKSLEPFDDWLRTVSAADVALDVLPRNNERELAFPTRTAMALWAGLPTLHGDYDELGAWIGQTGAGWAIEPEDRQHLRETILGILNEPSSLAKPARAARQLGQTRLNWAETIGPLAGFCRAPARRELKSATVEADNEESSRKIAALERDLAESRAETEAVLGKWPIRFTGNLKKLTWLVSPVLYVLGFAVTSVVATTVWLSDLFGGSRESRAEADSSRDS